jgi:hypothetical protein
MMMVTVVGTRWTRPRAGPRPGETQRVTPAVPSLSPSLRVAVTVPGPGPAPSL